MKRYFGDKAFYKAVLALLLPMLLQNTVSSFVNLLDNLMVGRTGTEQMSGVSIVNQLIFIYNLCIFGGTSGAGIFAAQFFGKRDHDGVRQCLRFNLFVVTFFTVIALVVLVLYGTPLVQLYLTDDGQADLAETLRQAQSYLKIALLGIAPFAVTNAFSVILRSCGDTDVPMKASILALVTNLVGNYILIFGHLGFAPMGVRGAAIATVISRYFEVGLLLFLCRKRKLPYVSGLFRNFMIPKPLFLSILGGSLPLLFNELFWSLAEATLTQNYSLRGITAIAALNITSVVVTLCVTAHETLGSCVGIILGNDLGAGNFDKAKENCPRLMMLALLTSALTMLLMFGTALLLPRLFNTSEIVKETATKLICTFAIFQPFASLCYSAYFAIRSGGRTLITVLFDSIYTWLVVVPTCVCLIHFTDLPLLQVYFFVKATTIIKASFGIFLLKKGVWIRNIVTS